MVVYYIVDISIFHFGGWCITLRMVVNSIVKGGHFIVDGRAFTEDGSVLHCGWHTVNASCVLHFGW